MATVKGKEAKKQSPTNKTKSATCKGKKGRVARACWSRIHQDKTVNEVEGAKVDTDAAEEFVFTTEKTVEDVSLSQSGCESHEDGLVMFDSGASVNVSPNWFEESALEQSDGSVRLRSADGRTLQDYGKRQVCLRIGDHYDFHVADDKTDPECQLLVRKRN